MAEAVLDVLDIPEYPKIETLFDRKADFSVDPDKVRCHEFDLVSDKAWIITEKIDGTNVRVLYRGDHSMPLFFGRTANSQMPTLLVQYLQARFTTELFETAFPWLEEARKEQAGPGFIVLYGEGYGPKIQKGGGNYRSDVGFRLFDVRVGSKWLDWSAVVDVARKVGVEPVPVLSFDSRREVVDNVKNGASSVVAFLESGRSDHGAEGIVARTEPALFDWRGHRIMWKLKTKDFVVGAR